MRAWNALLARCGRGNTQAPTPFKGGFLVPIPPTLFSVVGGGNVGMSNALRIDLKP